MSEGIQEATYLHLIYLASMISRPAGLVDLKQSNYPCPSEFTYQLSSG